MRNWLATIVVVVLVVSSAAHAQTVRVQPLATGKAHAGPNFAMPQVRQFRSGPILQDGMIAEEELAPNAHVAVGLAPMRGRDIHSVMTEKGLVPTRNPGVTFVFRFPG